MQAQYRSYIRWCLSLLLLALFIPLLVTPAAAQEPPAAETIPLSTDPAAREADLAAAVADSLAGFTPPLILRDLRFDGRILLVDLGPGAQAVVDAEQFPEVLHAIDEVVTAVLMGDSSDALPTIEYQILIAGEPLAPQAEPAPEPELTQPGAGRDLINGKLVMINPGHGWYYTGSSWALQRGWWNGIVEDFINADLALELTQRLSGTGATVRTTREMNRSAGNHSSAKPWWQMGAAEYAKRLGAPSWVWNTGSNGLARDIMARPYLANWMGANATISIHNNGGRGCGTETWYDTSNAYAAQSRALADRVQGKIIERLRAQWNPNWCNRGVKGSNGGYGEIRAVNGPAVLIELAFMDTDSDNRALQDPRFRSIVTQAISDAVTEYFGGSAVTCPAGSFRAEFFANTSLSGAPVMTRCESSVNVSWGSGSPGAGLYDNFSVRWTGTFGFPAGYTAFTTRSDDGIRLAVDGVRLIDKWVDQSYAEHRATRYLNAGNHTVTVEYYERTGDAAARAFWSQNLALQSPTFATSQESATYAPIFGNDGNGNTRWSSRQGWNVGDEWWWTKIGPRQTINQVQVKWEAAYAAEYCVAWWSDGETQAQMICYQPTAAGTYTHNIGDYPAQYVGLLMRKRAWNMLNYSFFEMGVYRRSAALLASASDGETPAALNAEPIAVAIPHAALAAPSHRAFLPLVR